MAAYKSLDEHLFHHLEQLYPDLGSAPAAVLRQQGERGVQEPSAVEPTLSREMPSPAPMK